MHSWVVLLGSLATIAVILTAFGLMLRIVKPADALNHIGAILGIVIVLMIIPGVLVSAWLGMALWQQIALGVVGIGILQWFRPKRRARHRKGD
jgi:predicted tellurium resistance membrane protein TerC